jgi:hypothetical protein
MKSPLWCGTVNRRPRRANSCDRDACRELGGARLTPAVAIVCVQSGPKLPETIAHLALQPWAGHGVAVLLRIYA